MAEWIIAGLLGGILLILYVELRESARAHRLLEREIDKLDQRMELSREAIVRNTDLMEREIDKLDRRMELSHEAIVRNTDRMASDVRELRKVIEGEGT